MAALRALGGGDPDPAVGTGIVVDERSRLNNRQALCLQDADGRFGAIGVGPVRPAEPEEVLLEPARPCAPERDPRGKLSLRPEWRQPKKVGRPLRLQGSRRRDLPPRRSTPAVRSQHVVAPRAARPQVRLRPERRA